MSMVVKNNMSALRTLNVLNQNQSALTKSLAKVSSGMKVNSAADDASAYAISERMRVQMRSLDQDSQNIQNDQALLKTAEGAVNSTMDLLKTMKEKAIDAANDSNTDDDRATIQKELNQFIDQVDDNALMTFNGKYLIDGSTSKLSLDQEALFGAVATDYATSSSQMSKAKNAVIKGLSTEWIGVSLDLIKDSFGLSFVGMGPSVQSMNVYLTTGGSYLAATSSYYDTKTRKTTGLDMYINMNYYSGINVNDVNGSSTNSGSVMLDRIVAHELTHAVMSSNITNFVSLPKYIKEGAAELVHGAEDIRKNNMFGLLKNPNTLNNVLKRGSAQNSGANAYGAGFMILRYMAKEGAAKTGKSQVDVIKTFMSTLVNKGGWQSGLNSAINAATGGKFKNESAMINSFVNLVKSAKIKTDTQAYNFLKKYCGINYITTDTGSIIGFDAGGPLVKAATNIVKEKTTSTASWTLPKSSTNLTRMLTVKWPSGYYGQNVSGALASNYMIEYYTDEDGNEWEDEYNWQPYFKMTQKKLTFQSGTGANQGMNAGFLDMRAKALGLVDDEGNKLQVTTVDNAKNAISVIDDAISYTLYQQTDIGAMQRRLDFTLDNITTSRENVQSAESTIRDADMAKEMTAYTKNNVLLQAAQSMLAQANQSSSNVLSLLQ